MNERVENLTRQVHTYLNFCVIEARRAASHSNAQALDFLKRVTEDRSQLKGPPLLVSLFAQFIVSAHSLNYALSKGELTEMGNWIGWSLSDAITDTYEAELHIGRIVYFFESDTFRKWPGFEPTFVVYLRGFYYYARRRTAMKEVGENLWGTANLIWKAVINRPPETLDIAEISLGSEMLAWAAKESPELANKLTPIIETAVDNRALPDWARSFLCLTLATNAGRFSSKPPVQWAKRALVEFSDSLVQEQRVQMLVTAMDSEGEAHEIEDILDEMDRIQSQRKKVLPEIAFFRDAALRIETVQPFFSICLRIPQIDNVIRGVECWHQIHGEEDRLDSGSVLVTMPFGEIGYVAVSRDAKQQIISDRQALLEKLTRESNAFLGAAQTVAYADNSDLTVPERPGVPNVSTITEWARTLREAYCPESIACPEGANCQLILPTKGHPIQAVQFDAWGTTWPIAASLLKPRSDRRVKRVALWSGGGSMTEAMEIEAVEWAFKNRGIAVDIFSNESCSIQDFLAAYQNDQYDVFWVASHGEFDHWSPEKVTLQIAHDRTCASLDDLWEHAPVSNSRRLLVLNVCDGARFEETGILPKIGLAPALAGPTQATISHMWPVMGFPSAAFGAYLAFYLAEGRMFFDAYIQALRAIRKRAAEVANDLQGLYGKHLELIERISQRDEDFAPIEISGSAAFFQ